MGARRGCASARGAPHRDPAAEREALRREAEELHAEEVERCHRIGGHGAELLRAGAQVLTHCNAGALATAGYGTALGVIRAAHRRDPSLHVWVDETRPLLQGARLTAWELREEGISATLITDSTAGWLMAQGKVDAVITGADRIARNGDAANKIGTYALSVLARVHNLPFYVAAPTSTIDPAIATGEDIPIEHRRPDELGPAVPEGFGVYNPAFDVTPAANISAIITEHGVRRPPYRFARSPGGRNGSGGGGRRMSDDGSRELRAALSAHGQDSLLRFWDELDRDGRERLERDLRSLDLDLARPPGGDARAGAARRRWTSTGCVPSSPRRRRRQRPSRRASALRPRRGRRRHRGRRPGHAAGLRRAQGLLPDRPGHRPLALPDPLREGGGARPPHGRTPPLYVMTSDDNHAETEEFLTAHGWFGLEHLRLFTQGTMPAVDAGTGAVLLADRDRVALSPDGHGGTLRALPAGRLYRGDARPRDRHGLLPAGRQPARSDRRSRLPRRRTGWRARTSRRRSCGRRDPAEKVGVVAERDGRQCVIEYSDLPDALAEQRLEDGRLAFAAGSIALHVFSLEFIAGVADSAELPYHRALKPVAHVDDAGRRVEPDAPNAVKFEQFIFDTLPLARRALVLETARGTEFEPLKNASGDSSPETVRRRLSEAAAAVLEGVGAIVPRDADGVPVAPIELGPLIADDREELARRVPAGTVVDAPVALS